MKKTKLLLPLTAVAGLTATIPAMCLTSCNKGGSTKSTKPTEEEWKSAFDSLNTRSEGLCWHTSTESYVSYSDDTSYQASQNAVKYTNVECGQKYGKISSTYKVYGTEGATTDTYSTMNSNAMNLNIEYDEDEKNWTSSTATVAPSFQTNVIDALVVYSQYYTKYTYSETTKEFEYKGDFEEYKGVDSKIKFNDNKKIDYIEATAKDGDYYFVMNLHFTYDTTEIAAPKAVTDEITRSNIKMVNTTATVEDEESELGIDRGVIVHIKPSYGTYTTITASYPTESDTPSIFAGSTTHIYKNGTLLKLGTDYEIDVGAIAKKITFRPSQTIKATDTIELAFNLNSMEYFGGTTEKITITLA